MQVRRLAAVYAALLAGFAVVLCRLYLTASNTGYAAVPRTRAAVTLGLAGPAGRLLRLQRPAPHRPGRNLVCPLPARGRTATSASTTPPAPPARPRCTSGGTPPPLSCWKSAGTSAGWGVYAYPASRRYCAVPLCQHLIGYLDGEGRGVAGLEATLDPMLAGSGSQDTVTCTVTGQGRLVEGTQRVYTPRLL